MHWYTKLASTPLQIAGYSTNGTLAMLLKGKRYEYYDVAPPTVEKLRQLIRHQNWKAAFALLKKLSDSQEENMLF